MEYIHDLLLANAEAHVRLGLPLVVLILHTDVEALLVEIGRRLVVVQVLELLRHGRVLLQARGNLLPSIVVLGIYEALTELQETLLGLRELLLLDLAQLVVILLGGVRLNLTGRRVRSDVVEVDVSLEVALLHQLDGLAAGVNLVLQFVIIILLLEVRATARHVLLVLVEPVAERLLAVLVDHGRLRFQDELFALFPLRFLLYLPDLRMGVINWIDPHIFKLLIIKLYL